MKKYFVCITVTISLAAMQEHIRKPTLSQRIADKLAQCFCITTYEHDVSDEKPPLPPLTPEVYFPPTPSGSEQVREQIKRKEIEQ